MKNNKEYLFTFGFGHENEGHCQPIFAPDGKIARETMVAKYGSKWAFVYSREEWEDNKERFGDSFPPEIEMEPIFYEGERINE